MAGVSLNYQRLSVIMYGIAQTRRQVSGHNSASPLETIALPRRHKAKHFA